MKRKGNSEAVTQVWMTGPFLVKRRRCVYMKCPPPQDHCGSGTQRGFRGSWPASSGRRDSEVWPTPHRQNTENHLSILLCYWLGKFKILWLFSYWQQSCALAQGNRGLGLQAKGTNSSQFNLISKNPDPQGSSGQRNRWDSQLALHLSPTKLWSKIDWNSEMNCWLTCKRSFLRTNVLPIVIHFKYSTYIFLCLETFFSSFYIQSFAVLHLLRGHWAEDSVQSSPPTPAAVFSIILY